MCLGEGGLEYLIDGAWSTWERGCNIRGGVRWLGIVNGVPGGGLEYTRGSGLEYL